MVPLSLTWEESSAKSINLRAEPRPVLEGEEDNRQYENNIFLTVMPARVN